MILVCERFQACISASRSSVLTTDMQGPMKLIPRKGPKPYFFQDLDLSKIQKIIKCEAITTGA